MTHETQKLPSRVLIVGAGPTGLVLALNLARRGVPLRIIDKNPGPGQASRAMVVHARVLEFYQQLGLSDQIVAAGVEMSRVHLRKNGKDFGTLLLRDIGQGLSPFPFALCYPQDDHERFLVEQLRSAGIEVEWGVALREFSQSETQVRAILDKSGSEEVCNVDYLCGCDGAHSTLRRGLGIEFVGGTYENLFYVADVKVDTGFTSEAFMNVGGDGFALMLPVRGSGMQRLIGIVPREVAERHALAYEDIRSRVEPLLHVRVTEVNWFATYRVHHRVAERFRVGRCFIAGDAGHIHSPTGGQGMNTGIGDAVNLSWKIAGVVQGRADPTILDTFEAERLPFARSLVSTTDRAFQGIAGRGAWSWVIRTAVIPTLIPLMTLLPAMRRILFRTVSQIRIRYPQSDLSVGRAGSVRGGDRLPWVRIGQSDNFVSLQSLDWQLHVYGTFSRQLLDAAGALELATREFPWSDEAKKAGLKRDAAYLVRPDGHVAMASADQDTNRLNRLVIRFGLRFGTLANS